jgi:hypothetical protein
MAGRGRGHGQGSLDSEGWMRDGCLPDQGVNTNLEAACRLVECGRQVKAFECGYQLHHEELSLSYAQQWVLVDLFVSDGKMKMLSCDWW